MGSAQNEYTPEELRRITANLRGITERVHSGEFNDRNLDLGFVRLLHHSIFDGVRDHAGKVRGNGDGTEYLVFGPNRSVHRGRVAPELAQVFGRLNDSIRSFRDNPDDANYERLAMELAVWAHAQLVRVHPFEDGNGRTSRLLLAAILVALGLRPIPAEFPRQEYNDALNRYFQDNRAIGALVDLFVRCYPLE